MCERRQLGSLLIAGCGYLGQQVAKRWHAAGGTVFAITRSAEKARQFRENGWTPIVLNLGNPVHISLPSTDFVFWAVGFIRERDTDRRLLWINGLNWLINSLSETPSRFIYTSSTSVYGNVDNENVDEDTATEPETEGGKVCQEAEQIVLSQFENKATCLRMAGIYGPNRLLRRISDLQEQKPLAGYADHWLNLIHVDDAARVVCHLLPHDEPLPEIINVTNRPTITRQTYYSALAELSQSPPPVFGGTSGMGRPRSRNKNVNTRYRSLFPDLKFDDVLKGLNDAFEHSNIS